MEKGWGFSSKALREGPFNCSECLHWGNEGKEEKDRGVQGELVSRGASSFSDKKGREREEGAV